MNDQELSTFLARLGRVYIESALKKTCPQTDTLVLFNDLSIGVVPFDSENKIKNKNKLAKIQTSSVCFSPKENVYFLDGKTTIQILRRVSAIFQRNDQPRLRNAILFGAVLGTKFINVPEVDNVENKPLEFAFENRI